MKEIILVKNGELALKGLNRKNFEDRLIKNIKTALSSYGQIQIFNAQSTIYIRPVSDDYYIEDALDALSKVFGIATITRAAEVEKDMDVIMPSICEYLGDELKACKTFKLEAKRADKTFPLKSPQICCDAGEYVLEHCDWLKVDVHNPDITINVEIRDKAAYIHGKPIKGAGGLPIGTGGKVCVMISGGIDSPVASWMMAKRGLSLIAVNFASPPYTSQRAEDKVKELVQKVADWAGNISLFIVPFAEIQESIRDYCPEELITVISRRYMVRISQIIAEKEGALALVSGESVGQVASQTLRALECTDAAATMPIFRPVIGMDKEEIISIARKIETFDISILPFEDCCTVFTPKHPKTNPVLKKVEEAELMLQNEKIDISAMVEKAVNNAALTIIKPKLR